MRTAIACLALASAAFASTACTTDRTIKYLGYELTFDCEAASADRWAYTLGFDNGKAKRPSGFYTDPNLPTTCKQQKRRSARRTT
ncbi:hypothetical protein SDRG_13539, partial [Saprolegnia diclina VS20]